MPANTPRGFPYPLPSEPVAEGAQAIRNLAEAIDAKDAGRELAYVENTGNVLGGAGEGTANPLVTFPALAFDGATPIVVEYFCPELSFAAVANIVAWTYLFELVGAGPAVSLGIMGVLREGTSAIASGSAFACRRRFTPTAGTKTYSIRASQSGGNATWQGGAGGVGVRVPMFGRMIRA